MQSNARTSRIVWVLVSVSLAARLYYAARLPIWFDEMFTQWLARQSPAGILRGLRLDSGPPFFYGLENPFVRLAELLGADWMARLPPFAFLAAVSLSAFRRRASAGPRFLLLTACCPLLFFYSADARAYAPLAAFSFFLFLSAFRSRQGTAALIASAFLSAALPWTHYLGIFVVAGSLMLTAARKNGKSFLAQAIGAGTFALWLPSALAQPAASLSWSEESFSASLSGALEKYGFWGSYPGYLSGFRAPWPQLGAILGLTLILGSLREVGRRRAIRESLGFAFIPILLAALFSFWRPIFFTGRTEMATLPVALWAFARASRHSRFLKYGIQIAALAGAAVILRSFSTPPGEPPYGLTARFLQARVLPGDAVVAADANYLPIRLLFDRGTLHGTLLGLPASTQSHPGWFEPGVVENREAEKKKLDAFLFRLRPGSRAYFVIPPDPPLRALALPFFRGRRISVVRPNGGDEIVVVDW
jgi:hypothetical protein